MADFNGAILTEDQVASLPDPLKAQFAKTDDGKWAQKVPDPNEDTSALKNGLEAERAKAKKLEKAATDAQAKLAKYQGINPDEYAELKQKAEEAEQARLKAEGKEHELWERKRVSLEEAHQQTLSAKDQEIADLRARLNGVLIDEGAVSLAAALPGFKGTPKAVEILKRIARDELKVDGEAVVPIERDGSPRVTQGRNMTVKEWAEGLVKDYGDILFEGSSGGGAINGKGGTPSGKKLKDMSPLEKAQEIQSVGLAKFQERVAAEYSG